MILACGYANIVLDDLHKRLSDTCHLIQNAIDRKSKLLLGLLCLFWQKIGSSVVVLIL